MNLYKLPFGKPFPQVCLLSLLMFGVFDTAHGCMYSFNRDSDQDGIRDYWENHYKGKILFFDAFEDGALKPEWQIPGSQWINRKETMYFTPEDPLAQLAPAEELILQAGKEDWTDYELSFYTHTTGQINIFYRLQSNGGDQFNAYRCSLKPGVKDPDSSERAISWEFGTTLVGQPEKVQKTLRQGQSEFPNYRSNIIFITLRIRNNEMIVWANNKEIGRYQDDNKVLSYGGIGIQFESDEPAWIDKLIVREIGMNPYLADADIDYDEDGYSNLLEYDNQTNPIVHADDELDQASDRYFDNLGLQEAEDNDQKAHDFLTDEVFRVNAYPNPARDKANIMVTHSSSEPVEIRVFNYLGKQVWYTYDDKISYQLHKTIDLTDLPAGNYVVQVKAGPDFRTHKLAVM